MTKVSDKIRKINYCLSETNGLYHRMSINLGLSDSVSNILYILYDRDGSCLLSEMCTELGVPKQTINSALRGLEKDGILYLENCGIRSKKAVLSEKGMQFCMDTVAHIFDIENMVIEEFTAEEFEMFAGLHARYNESLKRYIADMEVRNG